MYTQWLLFASAAFKHSPAGQLWVCSESERQSGRREEAEIWTDCFAYRHAPSLAGVCLPSAQRFHAKSNQQNEKKQGKYKWREIITSYGSLLVYLGFFKGYFV